MKTLLLLYCGLCRFGFEWLGVVLAWFVFSRTWAAVVTSVFVVWQLLGFAVLKINKQ